LLINKPLLFFGYISLTLYLLLLLPPPPPLLTTMTHIPRTAFINQLQKSGSDF